VRKQLKKGGMNLEQRIDAISALSRHLAEEKDEYLLAVQQRTYHNNQWFTIENQQYATRSIVSQLLNAQHLSQWLAPYNIPEKNIPKTVGMVLSGNVPLAGFRDLLFVFLAGHRCVIKLSEQDQYILPYFIRLLEKIDPATKGYFSIAEKLKGFDAVIAMGSNDNMRYFEAYFGRYPNIIRKNKHAVAVLDGTETQEALKSLGSDIFRYFGLSRRNISKLYVPENYDFEPLLEVLHEHKEIVLNSKYKNNFDYHYAIYIINRAKYLANGCIILREAEAIASPIANLHYQYYQNTTQLQADLKRQQEDIQLISTKINLNGLPTTPLGSAFQISLGDAESVETMQFLLKLSNSQNAD
ncbi:MAG: acyl-CoA reductase, partial [Bacteroidota bacterium]